MNIYTDLGSLHEGECCTVKRVELSGRMRNRLGDLGLVSGTRVECLHRSWSGGLAAYLIKGAVVALRHEDSTGVIVQKLRAGS